MRKPCNYEAAATDDDGSCLQLDECGVCGGDGIAEGACDCEGNGPDAGYDCDGNCLNDADGDGVCDEFEVAGCQDAEACNYNADATDAGDCEYAEEGYDCDGNCLNDADGDGVCDEFEIAGCQDAEACNYNADATDDDGSCTYADAGYDCDGNCLNDADGDGVCDVEEIIGCTIEYACNYDPPPQRQTMNHASTLPPSLIVLATAKSTSMETAYATNSKKATQPFAVKGPFGIQLLNLRCPCR